MLMAMIDPMIELKSDDPSDGIIESGAKKYIGVTTVRKVVIL